MCVFVFVLLCCHFLFHLRYTLICVIPVFLMSKLVAVLSSVHVCVHLDKHMCVCIQQSAYIYIYNVCLCVCARLHTFCICVCTLSCVCVRASDFTRICICVWVCMHMCSKIAKAIEIDYLHAYLRLHIGTCNWNYPSYWFCLQHDLCCRVSAEQAGQGCAPADESASGVHISSHSLW